MSYSIQAKIIRISKKVQTSKIIASLTALFTVPVLALLSGSASAATNIIVTPTNQQGWSTADTRPGGTVSFSMDNTAPGNPHNGALQLSTDSTTAAKAQYMHSANTPLTEVNQLSYSTKQISGPPEAAASYQLPVCLGGTNSSGCIGFTTLVYEPYWNGTVTPGVWQHWDVDQGLFWSSSTFSQGSCNVVKAPGGPPTYTLAALKTACPDAVVVGFGVNIGSFNPNYNVETDLFQFNDKIYNFEPYFPTPKDKEACKDNGFQDLTDQNGQPFKNQGQCVSWTNGRGQ
jgi:hypothetical protein